MNEKMYHSLYRIRRVEEEIAKVYSTDKIKSPVHLSIGQEAVSVGVCLALKPKDIVFGTYRGHALYLAKGGNLKQMIAELYGKVTGCARGKGGSMHLIDVKVGVMGGSAVVATTIPQAVGYAYALKIKKSTSVVVSFFGDGAVDEGVFYESINFAALKKLPMLFICENNLYAIHTHQDKRQANSQIWKKAKSFGMPAERIEGNDIFTIYQKVLNTVKAIRRGEDGPFFFECMTYRFIGHVGPAEDFHLGYRTKAEAEPWLKNDPVYKLAMLIKAEKRQRIEEEVEKEIAEAFEYAEKSPFPKSSELFANVFMK